MCDRSMSALPAFFGFHAAVIFGFGSNKRWLGSVGRSTKLSIPIHPMTTVDCHCLIEAKNNGRRARSDMSASRISRNKVSFDSYMFFFSERRRVYDMVPVSLLIRAA